MNEKTFLLRMSQSRASDAYFVVALILVNVYFFTWNNAGGPLISLAKYLFSFTAFLIFCYVFLVNSEAKKYKSWSRIFLVYFLAVSIVMIGLSPYPSLNYIKAVFDSGFYFMPYFLPLLLLFTRFTPNFFARLFSISFFFMIASIFFHLYLLLSGINVTEYRRYLSSINIFNLAFPLMFLSSHLLKNSTFFILGVVNISLNIILVAQLGRRGGLVGILLVLLALIMIRFRSTSLSFGRKLALGAIITSIIIAAAINFGAISTNVYAFQRGMNAEGFRDSREHVFEDYFADLNTYSEILLGRGLNGQVRRDKAETGYASSIENGYLTVILKGGLIYLLAMISLFLRAIYLGVYRSNNDLTMALAALIAIQLIGMLSFSLPVYSTPYIMVWVAVSTIHSTSIRTLTNQQLAWIFQQRIRF